MESTAKDPSDEPVLGHGLRILEEAAWLRRFAQGLAGSGEEADDLTQESMIAALGHGVPARNPRGFLSEIARRLSAQARRESRRRRERETIHARRRAEGTDSPPGATDAEIDRGFEEAERVDMMRLVLEELRNLPTAQQRAITLAYMDELAPAQIAKRLDVSPATVRAHLSRGLAALRDRLDRRSGGRDPWLSALAPWLATRTGPIVPGAANSQAAEAVTAKAGTGALLPSSLLLVLGSMKYFLAVGVPALIVGLWWVAGPGDGDAPEGSGLGQVEQEETARLAPVGPTPPQERPGTRTTVATDNPVVAPPAAPEPGALSEVRSLRLMDRLTGEPVPQMKVRVWPLSQMGRAGLELTSDSTGALTLPPHEQGEALMLSEHDLSGRLIPALGMGAGGARTGPIEMESTAPYEVEVGPTYRIQFPGDFGARWEDLTPRLVTGETAAPGMDSKSILRDGEEPWVRFPFQATEIEPGPYRLRLEDRGGLWLGQCDVGSNVGIEPRALLPTFEARGAVRFELEVDAAPVITVSLEPLELKSDPWSPLTFTIGRHGGGQRVHGIADLLVPGSYRWAVSEGDSTGEILVEAGKTTTVVLGEDDLGATFDSHVLIDMTAHPEHRPSSWLMLVTKKDDGTVGFMASAESTDTPHQYKVPLTALSHGTWILSTHSSGEVRLSPSAVEITPGSPPPTIRALPPISREGLTIELKDADTGRTIAGGEGGFLIGRTDGGPFEPNSGGALSSERVPTSEAVELFVRAPGYQLTVLTHRIDQDGNTREIELRKGWRNRALVLNAAGMTPLAGISLRAGNQDLGKTPAGGWLWVEGAGPPKRIELVDPEGRYQVLNSPYDIVEDRAGPVDPLPGWVFVVAEKRK